ncbi:hypothetical protein V6Z11_D11G386400 [Gossypium hirsutum]
MRSSSADLSMILALFFGRAQHILQEAEAILSTTIFSSAKNIPTQEKW